MYDDVSTGGACDTETMVYDAAAGNFSLNNNGFCFNNNCSFFQ
jgi:hypothetical protein